MKNKKEPSDHSGIINACIISLEFFIALSVWLRRYTYLIIINIIICIIILNVLVTAINNEYYYRNGKYIVLFPKLTLFYIFCAMALMGIALIDIMIAFRNDKTYTPYYNGWDLVCEEDYEGALEQFEIYEKNKKDQLFQYDTTRAQSFCYLCMYYRDKEYYVVDQLEYHNKITREGELSPIFKTKQQREFYNIKMEEIRTYVAAHKDEIVIQHSRETLAKSLQKLELEKKQKKIDEDYKRELQKQPYPEIGMTEDELQTTCLGKATNLGNTILTFTDAYGNATSKKIEGTRYSFEYNNDKLKKVYAYVDKGKVTYIQEEDTFNKNFKSSPRNSYNKSKNKSKDQMDYDIDTYHNDYKNSDSFVDEDDAWDDFEDNDGWDDY